MGRMAPESREEFVEVDGARLWTVRTGSGPALVLLHGGPGLPDYLQPLADLLPARVHRYEQRACGRSDDRGPFTLDRALADLDALRRHWDLGRMVLAGHSWGAALALLYALENPECVERLLYLDGMGIEEDWKAEHKAEVARRLGDAGATRLAELRRARDDARGDDVERDRFTRALLDQQLRTDFADPARAAPAAELFTGRVSTHANEQLSLAWSDRQRDPAFAPRVARLPLPVLVVQGALDPRPNEPARRLAALLPRARYEEIAGAGHFPWMERPGAFLRVVLPFLQGAA